MIRVPWRPVIAVAALMPLGLQAQPAPNAAQIDSYLRQHRPELARQLDVRRNDPLLRAISRDVAGTTMPGGRLTEDQKLFRIEQSVRSRLLLLELSRGAYPIDALRDVVPGVNYQRLRQAAVAPALDGILTTPLAKAFDVGEPRVGVSPQGIRRKFVEVVNPNTPLDDGVAPGVVPPGLSKSGKPFDPATTRRSALVWRTGFSYVVALATATDTTPRIFCSGALVNERWVLTAAHCLYDHERGGARELASFQVFLPFAPGGTTIFTEKMEPSANMTARAVAKVQWFGQSPFPVNEQQLSDLIAKGHDVALLQLAAVTHPRYPRSVELARDGTVSAPITFVGYGRTNAKRLGSTTLEVGTRNSPSDVTDFFLITAAADAKSRESRLCPYDSGAPVLEGAVDGSPGQSHRLIGIVSGAAGVDDGGLQICFEGQQYITRLNRAPVVAWYCDVTGNCR